MVFVQKPQTVRKFFLYLHSQASLTVPWWAERGRCKAVVPEQESAPKPELVCHRNEVVAGMDPECTHFSGFHRENTAETHKTVTLFLSSQI